MPKVRLSSSAQTRETLFLRLFGEGKVRALALEELAALPRDAWERSSADEHLVALRVRIPETTTNERERRFLMATDDLYEQWKQRIRQEGRQEGRREGSQQVRQQALFSAYQARFGSVPPELGAAMERVAAEPEAFAHWIAVVTTRPEQDIAAALLPEAPPRPARRRSSARRPEAAPRRRRRASGSHPATGSVETRPPRRWLASGRPRLVSRRQVRRKSLPKLLAAPARESRPARRRRRSPWAGRRRASPR